MFSVQNLSISDAFIFCAPFICWLPISFSSVLAVIKDYRVVILILAVESLVRLSLAMFEKLLIFLFYSSQHKAVDIFLSTCCQCSPSACTNLYSGYEWYALCDCNLSYSINFLSFLDDRKTFFSSNKKWILTNIVLSVFPFMPIVGNSDENSTEIL